MSFYWSLCQPARVGFRYSYQHPNELFGKDEEFFVLAFEVILGKWKHLPGIGRKLKHLLKQSESNQVIISRDAFHTVPALADFADNLKIGQGIGHRVNTFWSSKNERSITGSSFASEGTMVSSKEIMRRIDLNVLNDSQHE